MGNLTKAWNEEDALLREMEAPRPPPSLGSGYMHFACDCAYCMERSDRDTIHSDLCQLDLDGPRAAGWVPEAHHNNVKWCASRDEHARDQRAAQICKELNARYRELAKRAHAWPSVTWSLKNGQITDVPLGLLFVEGPTVTIRKHPKYRTGSPTEDHGPMDRNALDSLGF